LFAKPTINFGISVLLAALLCGCGGGGANSSAGGTTSSLVSNVVTVVTPTLAAGQSTPIYARAVMRGAAPKTMLWTAAPIGATNPTDPAPLITDFGCATATLVPPVVAGTSGEGSCQTILTISPTAKAGTWRITNTASGTAGTASSFADITISAMAASGFRLLESATPVSGYINQMLTLNVPFTANPGATVTNVRYVWTAAAQNPATLAIAGARSSSASVVPLVAGQYRFDVQVTADVNGFTETAQGSVVAVVYPPSFIDIVDAGAIKIAASGNVVTLVGTVQNQDPTLSYAYSWKQLSPSSGAAVTVTLANATTKVASFVAPSTAGTYGFEFKVTKTQADGTQMITTAQTSVIVQSNPTGTFTVAAGDVQSVMPGSPVLLNGSVGSQGSAADVVYTYAWSQVGATPAAVTLANASTMKASFIPPAAGTYTFDFTVSATTAAGTTTVSGRTQIVATTSTFVLAASAGAVQQAAKNSTVTLSGAALAQGATLGVTYAYTWTQVDASPAVVTLNNANTASASFYATVGGVYTMRLSIVATLTDGTTRTAQAQTQVVVSGGPTGAFTVSAGDAKFIGVNTVGTLQGVVTPQGGTTGTTFTYQWAQVGATPALVPISNSTALGATVVPTVAGTYTFELTVTGLQSGVTTTQSTRTQLIVTPAAVSTPGPAFALSANAGPAQAVSSNAIVTLTGSLASQGYSTGVTYSYSWVQVGASPTTVTLSNANQATATFLASTAGTYTFRLTVTATLLDATTRTATADTQVIVGGVGNTFSVSAGDAQTVKVNTAAVMPGVVTTQGSFNGATFSYVWTQVGTVPTSVTVSNSNAVTASFAPTVTGTYTFMLTVTCVEGGVTTTKSAQTQVLVTP
jgi:hypothetical protein